MTPPRDLSQELPPLRAYGERLGRHASAYAAGNVITLVLSLVSIAVVTRFLPPSEYGTLALLLLFTGLTTMLYNLGSLQGALMHIFGAGEDEDLGVAEEATPAAKNKRAAMGTGLALTGLIAALGTGFVAILSEPISHGLTGTTANGDLVLIAGIAGGLNAVWRLAVNVPRMERKPGQFIALSAVRPILVLGCTIPALAAGHGIRGAIIGLTVGSFLALLVSLVVVRRRFEVSFSTRTARTILRRGAPMMVVVSGLWLIMQGDLFVVSRYASDADVGEYRVASRIASPMSYLATAFLMAWSPIRRTTVGIEITKGHGASAGALMIFLFVLVGSWIVLSITVLSDYLVRVAPEGYAGASVLVPLLGAGAAMFGLFVVIHRSSMLRRRMRWYMVCIGVAVAVFGVAAFTLTPRYGGVGAAVATIIAFVVPAAGLLAASQRWGKERLPIPYRRLAIGVTLAAVIVVVAHLLADRLPAAHPAIAAIAIAAYPLLLVATGTLPARQARVLTDLARRALGRRRGPEERLAGLPPGERASLEALVGGRVTAAELAAELGTSTDEVHEGLIRNLRALSGIEPEPHETDAEVGEYLLSTALVAERDELAAAVRDRVRSIEEMRKMEATFEWLQRSLGARSRFHLGDRADGRALGAK